MKTQTTRTNDMLRVGVIHQGRIVEDHLFKTKARVTAGRSARNGLSLPAAKLPNHCKLIETRRGRQHLCFVKGTRGKVYTGDEVIDLRTAARRRLAERKGDRFFLPLGPTVRASVVMGDATFLIQRVQAPARARRMALPRAARGSWWRSLDRSFLSFLALSLFAQGGFEAVQEFYWRETGQFLVKERSGTPKLLQALVIHDLRSIEDDPAVVEVSPTDAPAQPVEPAEPSPTIPSALAVAEPMDAFSEGTDPTLALDVPTGPMTGRPTGTTRLVDAGDVDIDFTHTNTAVPSARPSRGPRLAGRGADLPSDGNVGAVRVLNSMFGEPTHRGIGVARHDDPWGGEGNEITSYAVNGDPNAIWDSDPGLIPTAALLEDQPSAATLVNALINETAPKGPMPVIAAPRAPLVVAEAEAPKARRIIVRGGKPSRVIGRGRLDAAAIRAEVRKRTPGLQRLFLDAVRKNRGLHGRIEVRITVGISGRAKVVVTSDRIGDKAFARSLTRRIAAWRFPKPKGGEVSFKVPFTFRAI